MDTKRWLSLPAMLALASCGFNGGALPGTQNRVTQTANTNQAASTNQAANTNQATSTNQTANTSAPSYRAAESTTPAYGYVVIVVSSPAGVPINASAVLPNGTSVPLARSTSVRVPAGSARIVVGNTMWQGTMYQPSIANQPITVSANRTTSVSIFLTALPRVGSLNIGITGSPNGTGALALTGPNFGMSIFRAGTLSNLAPGTYKLAAQPFTYGNKVYAAPAGTQNFAITAFATSAVTVAYLPWVDTMVSEAKALVNNGNFVEDKNGTKCNLLVQQFFHDIFGHGSPELDNKYVQQELDSLRVSAHWTNITKMSSSIQDAFNRASSLANQGQFVVVAAPTTTGPDPNNKNKTKTYLEHIVVVMPLGQMSGYGTYSVPTIAEATSKSRTTPCMPYGTNGVDWNAPLSCGFPSVMLSRMEIYAYTP